MAEAVVAKAECHAGGTNLRFVVTSLPTAADEQAEGRYDDYVMRGESEQRMDELKNGLHAGRLSCHRFLANFGGCCCTPRRTTCSTPCGTSPACPQELRAARPQTWRDRVIKVTAEVVRTTRRVVVRLAAQWPHWDLYRAVAARATAAVAAPAAPAVAPATIT